MFVFLETPTGIKVLNTEWVEDFEPSEGLEGWVVTMASGNSHFLSGNNVRTVFGVLSQKGEIRGNYRLAMKQEE